MDDTFRDTSKDILLRNHKYIGKYNDKSTQTLVKDRNASDDSNNMRSYHPPPPSNLYQTKIFIDWPLDSSLLSYINYKSLESLLSCCYNDNYSIEVMIISPKMANYYKYGSVIRLGLWMC